MQTDRIPHDRPAIITDFDINNKGDYKGYLSARENSILKITIRYLINL